MLIARGVDGDKELLILGLSLENVKRLVAGNDMVLAAEDHQGIPPGWRVVITFGQTELELIKRITKSGVTTPQTEVKIDPRLKE